MRKPSQSPGGCKKTGPGGARFHEGSVLERLSGPDALPIRCKERSGTASRGLWRNRWLGMRAFMALQVLLMRGYLALGGSVQGWSVHAAPLYRKLFGWMVPPCPGPQEGPAESEDLL